MRVVAGTSNLHFNEIQVWVNNVNVALKSNGAKVVGEGLITDSYANADNIINGDINDNFDATDGTRPPSTKDNTYTGDRYFEITFANEFHYDEIECIVIYNRSSTTDLKNKMKSISLQFYNTGDSRFPQEGYLIGSASTPGHVSASIYSFYGRCYPYHQTSVPTYYNSNRIANGPSTSKFVTRIPTEFTSPTDYYTEIYDYGINLGDKIDSHTKYFQYEDLVEKITAGKGFWLIEKTNGVLKVIGGDDYIKCFGYNNHGAYIHATQIMEDNNIPMLDGSNYNSSYIFPYTTNAKLGTSEGSSSSAFAWAILTGLLVNPKNYIRNEPNGDGLTIGNVSDISFYKIVYGSIYGIYNDGSFFFNYFNTYCL